MPSLPSVPAQFINALAARHVPVGTEGFVAADAIVIDKDRKAWIDPAAKVVGVDNRGNVIPFVREGRGFIINLSKHRGKWDLVDEPPASSAGPWCEVVQVDY